MKMKLLLIIAAFASFLSFQSKTFAQVINLGTAADFVLFTTNGAVTNVGITHLTGHVGSNVGGSTGFGNVDGVMHDQDPASAQATIDLNLAYLQLDAALTTNSPGVLLGGGMTLVPGVHSIPSAATLNGVLTLDAGNVAGAIFIIQIEGAFGVGTGTSVNLINGALACNVYWKVDGAVSIAPNATMRGTIVAYNDFISMGAGDSLEGRALSINGAIGVTNIVARTPLFCLAPYLTGPPNPNLLSTECFGVFSSIGSVVDNASTIVTGDVGSNSTGAVGFNPLLVTGTIHGAPNAVTAQAATDVTQVYNDLIAIPYDIELLYPPLFGNDLVLTPHTYIMNGAVTFTDTLYLNAQGNADAVFVFQVFGAFSTSTFSNIILQNGAQAKNVYWVINGAISIGNFSVFQGTIISQGSVDLLTGVTMYGRVLTAVGAVNTYAAEVLMPTSCAPFTTTEPSDTTVCSGQSATFTVYAEGAGLTYQWRKGNVNLVNGGNISGAQTATLTINPASIADVASNYNVIINGSFAPADTSINVSLSLGTAPVITNQPMNATVCEGQPASFTVVASGVGNTYQWRKGLVNLVNNVTTSGVNTATLTINPTSLADAANNYNVVVSGACLPNAVSVNVSLTVNSAPVITIQPNDTTVCLGQPASFTVSATGAGLTYQWRKGLVNLVNNVTTSGVNTATLTINPTSLTDAANNYNVVVSGTCSPDAISLDASLSFASPAVITDQPNDTTVCVGQSVSFTVVASGVGNTYQWRKGLVNLVNNASTSGVNTATLTINPTSLADAANNYNVVVSGTCSPDAISVNVTLTVETAPVITNQPNDTTVCIGEPVSFTVVASGPGITYQWRKGLVNLINNANTSGVNTATLTINSTTFGDAANNYNVVVSGTCSPDAISANVVLIVDSCAIDISVVKSASSMAPVMGGEVVFTVIAYNFGTYDATGVQVVDVLQNGYSYVSSTTSTGTYNSTTGEWNVGNLNVGDSAVLTITAMVNYTGDYQNTATISGNELEGYMINNVSTITPIPTDFFIPEGFSPNGDLVNDLFIIRGIMNYPLNEFTVFNRWGNKVFSAKPYENTWDGKSDSEFNVGGDVLPVGTYFYILDLGDGSDVYKGTIYLNN